MNPKIKASINRLKLNKKEQIEILGQTVQETRDDRPNLITSLWICVASSRVGAKTNTVGPFRELLCRCLRRMKAGIR